MNSFPILSIALIAGLILFNCNKNEILDVQEQEENMKAPDSLNIISLTENSLNVSLSTFSYRII